jgi:hypothetical protein
MEHSFKYGKMMIDDDGILGEISHSRPKIAEKVRGITVTDQIGRGYFMTDSHPEPDTCTQHRMTENRAGCYAVCIMVCKDLDIFLSPDLFCDSFCGG